jgi:hypothetical protein
LARRQLSCDDAVMVRLPRLVLPGFPYHVTQRGNRRQPTFLTGDPGLTFV